MTPTNRTDEVRKIAQGVVDKWYGSDDFEMTRAIASAITSAVEQERERCAELAEQGTKHPFDSEWAKRSDDTCRMIAKFIRQTPTKEGK